MRKPERVWYIVAGIAFVSFAVFCTLMILSRIAPLGSGKDTSLISTENTIIENEPGYAFETCYNGKPHLNDRLFWQPFGKSDDYISNNELLAEVGEEGAQLIVTKAKDLSEQLFHTAYKEKVREGSALGLADCIVPGINLLFFDGRQVKGNSDTASLINQWFVSTQTSMEASLQTDKCLVYYDRHSIILRGLLTFSVFESNDMDTLKDTFKIDDLQYGKSYSVITEMYFIPGGLISNYEDYRLARLEIL